MDVVESDYVDLSQIGRIMGPALGIIIFIFLGFIISFFVRTVIKAAKNKSDELIINENDDSLNFLSTIGILSDEELEQVTEIYDKRNQYKKYEKCFKVLENLKQIGYFTEEQHIERVDRLKKYFKID
jgi:hypothetical protein